MHKNTFQTDPDFLEKQVEPLFKATLSGGLANIFCAFLIFMFLDGSSQESYARILSLTITFLSVIRIYVSRHYLKRNTFKLEKYIHSHLFITFLIGVLWGTYAYMQLHYDDESLKNLVFLVNFGLMGASIATLSTLLYAYLAYMIPQSLAIFYVFVKMESEYNLQMAGAFVIFTGIMVPPSYISLPL